MSRKIPISMDFKMINWNIGGAKFLELPRKKDWEKAPHSNKKPVMFRDQFKTKLQKALSDLIKHIHPDAHAITLQEVVQYHENGDSKNAKNIFGQDFFKRLGYNFHFFPLIDTKSFSAQQKWVKIKKKGYWNQNAYFAQGNALLVKDEIKLFPVWGIPKIGVTQEEYMALRGVGGTSQNKKRDNSKELTMCRNAECSPAINSASETVFVEKGLYFGDRDTEPRAAIITHIVLDGNITAEQELKIPLDVFIINLHLTTLQNEREGIPAIDEKGEKRRMAQLDIVFNDIISRYNAWRQKKNYKLRDEEYPTIDSIETTTRHKPVWIVSGDFNFTPQSAEYAYIEKRNFISLTDNDPTKAKGLGEDPTLTVDYVFAGPLYYSIDPKDAERRKKRNRIALREKIRVSDHYPMLITVPILVEEVEEEDEEMSTGNKETTLKKVFKEEIEKTNKQTTKQPE